MCLHRRIRCVLGRNTNSNKCRAVKAKVEQTETWTTGIFMSKVYGRTKQLYNIREGSVCSRRNLRPNGLFVLGRATSTCIHRSPKYPLCFAPLTLRPNSPIHVLSKVHWRVIHLLRFEFMIDHIEGENNVFANVLARWSKGYRNIRAQQKKLLLHYMKTYYWRQRIQKTWWQNI